MIGVEKFVVVVIVINIISIIMGRFFNFVVEMIIGNISDNVVVLDKMVVKKLVMK